jgi:hypothetical protein
MPRRLQHASFFRVANSARPPSLCGLRRDRSRSKEERRRRKDEGGRRKDEGGRPETKHTKTELNHRDTEFTEGTERGRRKAETTEQEKE